MNSGLQSAFQPQHCSLKNVGVLNCHRNQNSQLGPKFWSDQVSEVSNQARYKAKPYIMPPMPPIPPIPPMPPIAGAAAAPAS